MRTRPRRGNGGTPAAGSPRSSSPGLPVPWSPTASKLSGYELRREVWQAHDRGSAAVRQILVNRGEQPIRLQALQPLNCDGPESLLLSGRGAGEWDVLVQKRFKNDGPTAFRPGVADADLEMALKPVGPTGEAVPEVGEGATLVRADPFCMMRSRGDGAAPALLIGYLSQTGHLARILLKFAEEEEGGVPSGAPDRRVRARRRGG